MRSLRLTASILFLLLLIGCSGTPSDPTATAVVQSGAPAARSGIRILNLDLVPTTPAPTWTTASTNTAVLPAPTLTVMPEPTLAETPAPTPRAEVTVCRDQAEFIRHLSVSPGTALLTGQWIAKLWRVKNTGGCIWNSDYSLRYVSGDTFGSALSQPLPQMVQPGENIDLRLVLLTPFLPGDYASEWTLTDPVGEIVPIASFEAPGSSSLWINITLRAAIDPSDKVAPDDGCG